ncbi:MAG: FCD domain-containing protein [Planctomycetaceae bacterium]|nr:FCD domain-containing protein [Planctomycetaceae bacterium]
MQTVKYTASQKVIDYLKRNIANTTWRIGDKIPSEHELTREIGVSRASIRMAIQQFIALGIMESHHGKGTFIVSSNLNPIATNPNSISEIQCRDIKKVLEFRAILEPEAAFLAVGNADDRVVANLKRHLDDLVGSIGDSEEFVRHDMLFHLEISRASDNPLVEKSLRDVFAETLHNHKQINDIFGFKDGVYYHSLIHKAFESRDPNLARNLMAEHLNQALDQLQET